jgi:hypothetical protein
VDQYPARKLPWPILTAVLALVALVAVLVFLGRAPSPGTATPPATPTARPSRPAARAATPIATPRRVPTPAEAVPPPTMAPTSAPEPTAELPPPTAVATAPAPAPGAGPQPLAVRAFRQGPDEALLAVTFSNTLPEKVKLKVEVTSAQQKLVKRQSVAAAARVDLGENIYAFEPELARHARLEPGQSVTVVLWVGDAPPRQFDVAVKAGWYEDVRGVRLAE